MHWLQEKSMLKDFKEFAMRGSVVDLAVGVIIGTAFGAIVTSLVNDVIMPPIGLLLGHVDFKDKFIALDGTHYQTLAEAKQHAAVIVNYGQFINTIINFLIVAFVIFLVVRQMNRLSKPKPAPAITTKECPFCASAIPLKAVRCPQCTSQLAAAATE
jgi:large conductance mechanosensitive channel